MYLLLTFGPVEEELVTPVQILSSSCCVAIRACFRVASLSRLTWKFVKLVLFVCLFVCNSRLERLQQTILQRTRETKTISYEIK